MRINKILLIGIIVGVGFIIFMIGKSMLKDDGEFIIEYIGEYEIEDNSIEELFFYGQTTPRVIYLVEDEKDAEEYSLDSNIFAQTLDVIERQYNLEFQFQSPSDKYLILSFGSKIEESFTMCVDDMSREEYNNTTYDGAVVVEDNFDDHKIYLYTIDRTDIWFFPVNSVIENYGDNENIKLVQINEDTVDLQICNPWKENRFIKAGSYDPTNEIKIYYYKYKEPYLYTINKWGRYMVVNISKEKVITRTYDLNDISQKHRKEFSDISEFTDISYIDNSLVENVLEIGDGTLFFSLSSNDVNLDNEKKREKFYRYKPFADFINLCFIAEEYLYVLDHNGYFKVIDVIECEIIEKSENINDISKKHRGVFDNLDNFVTEEELRILIETGEEKLN